MKSAVPIRIPVQSIYTEVVNFLTPQRSLYGFHTVTLGNAALEGARGREVATAAGRQTHFNEVQISPPDRLQERANKESTLRRKTSCVLSRKLDSINTLKKTPVQLYSPTTTSTSNQPTNHPNSPAAGAQHAVIRHISFIF